MDNLLITKTKSTLGVDFSVQGGLLNIEGSSYPENTRDFFEPLIAWINKFMLEETAPLILNCKIDYLNSSSIKFLSDIFDKLSNYSKYGVEVTVNWYYKKNDEDILEMGEDLKEDTNLNFNLIEM